MRIARFKTDTKEYYGQVNGEKVRVISGDIFKDFEITSEEYNLSEVKLLPPVQPRQVVCVGLNYMAHIGEFKRDPVAPEDPVIFLVPPSAIVGPEEEIILHFPEHDTQHEVELVVVVGREARQVPQEKAADYILGYTCGNDVSDRNIQKADKQWSRAKGYPTFKPLGPWIETNLNTTNLQLQCRVDGQVRQSSNTSNMLKGVAELFSFISSFMTLYPGDVIFTGTPEGVGPLVAKNLCEVEIEGIGILRNKVRL